MPWRNEDVDILGGYPTYRDRYTDLIQQINGMQQRYKQNAPTLDEALDDLQQYGPPEDMWGHLAPTTEQNRLIDEEERNWVDKDIDPQDLQDNAQSFQTHIKLQK